jgi:hypothetical protein
MCRKGGEIVQYLVGYCYNTGCYKFGNKGEQTRSFKFFSEDFKKIEGCDPVKSPSRLDFSRLKDCSPVSYVQEVQDAFETADIKECFLKGDDYLASRAVLSSLFIDEKMVLRWQFLESDDLQKILALFRLPESRPDIAVKLVDQLIDQFHTNASSFKRKRLPSSEFAFDCNLISQNGTSFEVHRDLVTNQGTYFSQAFAPPKSILVLREPEERVFLLFKALYDSEDISMSNVADCLELALKYDLPKLKDRALAFLQKNKIETSGTWRVLNKESRMELLCRILASLDRIRTPIMWV